MRTEELHRAAAADAPVSATARLAHLSDIHITTRPCRWRARDWFSKRVTSWMNLRLFGRGYRFRNAERVLAILAEELVERRYDHILFSGDATALGFEEEIARAAELLGVHRSGRPSGLAVPGNHDYCTRAAADSGLFERHFRPWQQGERIDGAVYPFAQRVGPAWFVAVNSATGNRWMWDASGAVGRPQLERLARLLAQLPPGPRILVTHYPVVLAGGRSERRVRELRDLDDVLAVAQQGGVRLWLHGHRHGPYHHSTSEHTPFPIVCAGSATQNGLWSYCDYSLTAERLEAQRRVFDPAANRVRDGEQFTIDLET